ncbi:DUF2339 domain-containing protein [Nocardia brevicatena]|uniref:DUF2339 domain-containing protein n=1 Tax=Nocardia brevicatena TaxID=37327 RepID=UPI001FDFAE25|nr:DUF2339 domain-containing protein [Nocardia brevicatena]
MTTIIDPALVERLSGEFTTLGTQMGALGRDLGLLRTQILASAPGAGRAETVAAEDGYRVVAGESAIYAEAPPGERIAGAGTRGQVEHRTVAETTGADETMFAGAVKPEAVGSPPTDAEARAGDRAVSAAAEVDLQTEADALGEGAGTASAQAPVGPVPPPGITPGWPGAPAHTPGAAGMPPGGWIPQSPYRPGYAGGIPPRYGGPGAGVRSDAVPPSGGWPKPVPRTPWWQRDGVISRLLAVSGVGVTLIGIVMLLVLAAQAGVFGPVPRVVAGAAFSAALVGVGVRVYGRDGGRVGGIALAATGIAGGYLDVIAVTAIYGWMHPVPGSAAALAVAAAGVGLAVRWRSQPLAVLVVAGAAALAPFVTVELTLLAFLIALQLVCLPVQLGRDWPFLHLVRTVPAVLATLVTCAVAAFDTVERHRLYLLLLAAVAVAVVGLVGAVAVVRRRPSDVVATLAFAAAATPLLVVPGLFDGSTAGIVAGCYAGVLLTVAASPLVPKLRDIARIPGHTATAAAVVGAFALLETCMRVADSRTLPIALFLVALGFFGVAGQRLSRVSAGIGGVFAVLGGLSFLAQADPDTLTSQRMAELRLVPATALAAFIGLALVVVAVWGLRKLLRSAGRGVGSSEERALWIVGGAVALYLVNAASVAIGTATGVADGFVLGHSVATMVWMVAATGALLYGLRNPTAVVARSALGCGLLVTVAALVKLFTFDLATLDGLIRVAAFLVVGILLLLAGTRYARAFAEVGRRNETPDSR